MAKKQLNENQFIAALAKQLDRDEHVHLDIPGGGILTVQKDLPYLLLHRFNSPDSPISNLLLPESNFLSIPADTKSFLLHKRLLKTLNSYHTRRYGSYMVIEIWESKEERSFEILAPEHAAQATVKNFTKELDHIKIDRINFSTINNSASNRYPNELKPLMSLEEAKQAGCLIIGLSVPNLMFKRKDETYPVFFRKFRNAFSKAIRKAIYEFIRVQTTCDITNYHELGPGRIGKHVYKIDEHIAQIESSFRFLLLVSPVNTLQAWASFKASRYEKKPQFHYRLLPVDPDILKRQLFNLKLEDIHDPAISYLFRNKREELDIRLSMLLERETPKFLYSSMRLFPKPEEKLLKIAEGILAGIEVEEDGSRSKKNLINARQFANEARKELDKYRKTNPDISCSVEIRSDISGLMVSYGNLLIPDKLRIKKERLQALINHEVGTHVLTFCNGQAQPFKQFRYGLAGYDELQEGIAVLAEYLCGGLDTFRMSILAGRVIAAHAMTENASFVECFRLLKYHHGFSPYTAFDITTRVYQCGGFTKDVIYLRGLVGLIDYLKEGGDIEPLFIGKIAQKHIPVIKELQNRGILQAPSTLPNFITSDEGRRRLETVRKELLVTDMMERTVI